MKFVYYSNLRSGAKQAYRRGTGKYRKYAVDGGCIAALDSAGRAVEWLKVIRARHCKDIKAEIV